MSAPTWPATAGPHTDLVRLAELVADTDNLIDACRATVADVEAAIGATVHLPRHCPGLEPLTDPALREVA
ncbi:hypothetical protein QTQ03_25465 [Micromonospora sp. WMMA1363]|uniref:hypothetical protein n=1 Tax=Micromonospora sp. WMMA1363 TaxID=3053985 RepID=UPI00259CCC9B|nr:hypothetical protein [Micromonospora sp. WMMA1363]MDM4721125.1 hypothetical protein [Micromonospora sp. WMMA1363]MDM4722785.1 hypothetical protein [Micromonospora sp. WMMA1363]